MAGLGIGMGRMDISPGVGRVGVGRSAARWS